MELISTLAKDRDVIDAVEELVANIAAKPDVYEATSELLSKSAHEVLNDSQV